MNEVVFEDVVPSAQRMKNSLTFAIWSWATAKTNIQAMNVFDFLTFWSLCRGWSLFFSLSFGIVSFFRAIVYFLYTFPLRALPIKKSYFKWLISNEGVPNLERSISFGAYLDAHLSCNSIEMKSTPKG